MPNTELVAVGTQSDQWSLTGYRVFAARLANGVGAKTSLNVGPDPIELREAFEAAGLDLESQTPSSDGSIAASGPYDVIVALDVLEQLSPAAAEALIDAMASKTGRIVVSVSASGRRSARQAASRSLPAWMAAFAERSFYRRVDVDLEPAVPGSLLLERGSPSGRDLAYAYEVVLESLLSELTAKRSILLQLEGDEGVPSAIETIQLLNQQVEKLRHQLLISRDHELDFENQLSRVRLDRDHTAASLAAVRASTSWRLGRSITAPAAKLREATSRFR